MEKYFGTDGVRGIANLELTNELSYLIGKYSAYVLSRHLDYTPTIVIGKDTRLSSDMLEASLIAGIMSVGCNCVQLGVIPTPAVSMIVRKGKFSAGIMISASHNSFEYNGIKIFNHLGQKLNDDIEEEIESYIRGDNHIEEIFTHEKLGKLVKEPDLLDIYEKSIIESVEKEIHSLKVLLDTANGATYQLAKDVFDQLHIEYDVMSDNPNGININDNCGSTHLKPLMLAVQKGKYDIGFSFDGDGDRVLAVDSKGNEVDGDKMMSIMAGVLKEKGKLKDNTLVLTQMSNIGVEKFLNENGIRVVRTKVGDRYVLEEMLANGYVLGGEQSGHIINMNYNTTGDGILSAVKFLEALVEVNRPLEELNEEIKKYPQVLVNVRVDPKKKNRYNENERLQKVIEDAQKECGDNHRLLIRPSGTEPLIRVMLEGVDESFIENKANEIAKIFKEELS